ncbi:hypothetical protein AC578_3196 [Pseudocercospora eumusae]|uniref:Glycoside hydrolase family 2 domain-containing protein n=1 Tax=Pseudocercospora eumusae TaxID=321146 RepID=A0A139H5K6_9PEZI|nr:hypothetical protein AC578_3196 [Pseudocercospora eumusae]
MTADRTQVDSDGLDLSFLTIEVVDGSGTVVPRANNSVTFAIENGPEEIVAADDGDSTNFTPFASPTRTAFNGLALGIVRRRPGAGGSSSISATADGLREATTQLTLA